MPAEGEQSARAFYAGLLGLGEPEKPAALAARGGAWFALPDGRQLHLGVEDPFLPSKKAHPAFVVSPLDEMAHKLEAAGLAVRWDDDLAPRRRFYGEDPFGNRLEFLEPEALRLRGVGNRKPSCATSPGPKTSKPQNHADI